MFFLNTTINMSNYKKRDNKISENIVGKKVTEWILLIPSVFMVLYN